MILLLWLFCSISATIAIPAWGGAPGRSSIGSLVPGATMIETVTIAAPYGATPITSHLSVPVQDHLGNLTAVPTSSGLVPPLFFINRDKLWLFRNESAIFPVNLVNATSHFDALRHAGQMPLQLVADTRHSGIDGGTWKWRGTRLQYHHGERNNAGIYYSCPLEGGGTGIFFFMIVRGRPEGCTVLGLHSFSRVNADGEWRAPSSD